jgi:Protein of unknown function (DUF4245)
MVDVEPASPAPAASPSSPPARITEPTSTANEPAPAPGDAAGPASGGDASASGPAGDAPVGDAPVGDAPVGDAPVGGAPVGGAPVGGAPARAGVSPDGDAVGVPGEGAVPDEATGASPRLSSREGRSPRDMVLSLAVLIVPIALLLIFYKTVLSGDAPITVDPSPTIQEAQQAKLFTVAVPTGLGSDWHASSATFTRQSGGATLRIGYVDPDKDPIQLVESSVPSATLLPAELTAKAKPLTNFRAANGVWRLYDGRPGEQALVLADQNRTIVVLGKTGVQNLEELASSLR